MKVFITGGSGFVGSALVRELAAIGIKSTVFDNQLSGHFSQTARYAACILGDVRNRAHLRESLPGHDIVVHLAGVVGAPACDIDRVFSYETNVEGTRNVVDLLTDEQKIINISSTSVYGDKAGVRVNEHTSADPLSSYGIHKLAAESLVESTGRYITFRPATAFGITEKIRVDLLPNTLMFEALHTKSIRLFQGEVIRPFIHVRDFARAIVWAITGRMPWNQVYNLGNPHLTMTKGELAQLICSYVPGASVVSMDGDDADKRNYSVDFSKFTSTSFDFTRVFYDGMQDMLAAYGYIAEHYDTCNTVYKTKAYLEKNGHIVK